MSSHKFYYENLFTIIVLYNTNLKDTKTYKSIISNNNKIKLKGIVYDNSYLRRDMSGLEELGDFIHIHDSSNPGLAYAYNYALKVAFEGNCKWLLLLDQDTYFTKEYFKNLSLDNNEDVVAYIPTVKSYNNRESYISPSVLHLGGFKAINEDRKGVQLNKISGINSGTIINCDFMNSIGGFNEEYPLDMLDHWYFREIYRKNKYVSVLNSEIFQNLSVQDDFEKNVSLSRYTNFIQVENSFFKTGNSFQYLYYKLRLLMRLLKQSRFKDKKYFKITIKKMFNFG